MLVNTFSVAAFSRGGSGGNPAGVVPEAAGLSVAEMQAVAADLAYPETVFILKSQCADLRLRFFTPTTEVELCGHATVGAFYLLRLLGKIGEGIYRQETNVGILTVEVSADGSVFMDQALPQFGQTLNDSEIAVSLGITEDGLLPNLPIMTVSTGMRDIFVPVRSAQVLADIKPQMDRIAAISAEWGASGYHVFCQGDSWETALCRNFAPGCGIPEEAATGTASGALACYLFRHGLTQGIQSFSFTQGQFMGQPSEVKVSLEYNEQKVSRVQVGGETAFLEKRAVLI